MSYKVIHCFFDLQDNNFPYGEGDIFPRHGFKVSEERIKELASENNKRRMKLIELVDDEPKKATKKKK